MTLTTYIDQRKANELEAKRLRLELWQIICEADNLAAVARELGITRQALNDRRHTLEREFG